MSKFNCRFFYKVNDRIVYINETSEDQYEESVRILSKKTGCFHYFEAFKGYTADIEGLLKFRKDFLKWSDEIECIIDYKKYYNHGDAVQMTFKRYANRDLKDIQLEPIHFTECYYMELTNNGGLIKLNPKYKNKTVQTYGYDHAAFYPWLFANSDFKFPIKQGFAYHIDKLNYKNLDFGIYHVIISCSHPDFTRFFSFSSDHYYTHTDILLAYKHRKQYNVKLELIVDCDENCLLYETSDIIDSKDWFGNWFERLNRAKQVYPKNKIIKHLMSSLWGHLAKFNRIFCDNEDEFNELDISKMSDPEVTQYKLLNFSQFKTGPDPDDYRTRYEYIDTNKPYSNDLARIKPFFTAYARNFIIDLLLSENIMDSVIRIHTDGIALNKVHDFTHLKYYPKPEDKTTGLFHWKNVNSYLIIEEEV